MQRNFQHAAFYYLIYNFVHTLETLTGAVVAQNEEI